MKYQHYFPRGLAEGPAFLGRDDELQKLNANIAHGYHTLLLAPRRFGKTSLVKQCLSTLKHPWVEIDLFVATDERAVEQKFLKGIQTVISTIDKPENWLTTLAHYFKKANKTWTIGLKGMQLELTPNNYENTAQNILDALNMLEHMLAKKKQKAVFFGSVNQSV